MNWKNPIYWIIAFAVAAVAVYFIGGEQVIALIKAFGGAGGAP